MYQGKPQSFYIIKAAQRREELQRRGDELDQAVSGLLSLSVPVTWHRSCALCAAFTLIYAAVPVINLKLIFYKLVVYHIS